MNLLYFATLLFSIFLKSEDIQGMAHFRIQGKVGSPTLFNEQSPKVDPNNFFLTSKIDFEEEGKLLPLPVIHYADVSVPDPLNSCPIDDATPDLKTAIDNLKRETSAVVQSIKDATAENCAVIQDQINAVRTNVGTAVTNQFVASSAVATTGDQNVINRATQQATAVNQLFLAASNLFQNNCVQKMDRRVVVQKLIGQAITFGGLFAGGWIGIGAAAGGQIVANLPLFTLAMDEAIDALKEDEERKNRLSFLCLYRQMAKTSCMLFADKKERFINGLDLKAETGAYKTTQISIEKIEKNTPELFSDIKMLRHIQESYEKLNLLFTLNVMKAGSIETFSHIKTWCKDNSTYFIQQNSSNPKLALLHSFTFQAEENTHPPKIIESLHDLRQGCDEFLLFDYPNELGDGYAPTLRMFYDRLAKLLDYYNSIKNGQDTQLKANTAKTWESKQYFDSLKSTVSQYQDMLKGNEARNNFFDLTLHLGDTLAQDSFSKMMKRNHDKFTKHYWTSRKISRNIPVHSKAIRSNALIAMLKTCQTLDPTLACIFVDPFVTTQLQKDWVNKCVGPQSTLCRGVLRRGERAQLLLNDPHLITYFDSLCGPDKINKNSKSGIPSPVEIIAEDFAEISDSLE